LPELNNALKLRLSSKPTAAHAAVKAKPTALSPVVHDAFKAKPTAMSPVVHATAKPTHHQPVAFVAFVLL
jgi:hypothetical protein